VATLDELREALFPGARLVAPRAGARSPEVSWVRVMKARVPAFDGLEPGDLAIVGRSDRYVDFEREFSRLLRDLVARRSG